MAYSYTAFTGNGSTTQYAVSFPYIRREHVAVTVAGIPSTFTWVNNSLIQMDAAPANGAAVRVYRTTPIDAPLVDFADGATLVAADLDTNSRQSIYIQQELDDAQTDNLPNLIPNGNKGEITTSVGGTVWAINNGAVTEVKLAANAVTSGKIADGTIVNADVNASAGITAGKLSFTQAGTGAVARTVDSRLKEGVSVKDFGAVGDGVADDTAAIQAAINAAISLGNKQVFLPVGSYVTSSTIYLNNGAGQSVLGAQLVGEDPIKTEILFKPGTLTTPCLEARGGSGNNTNKFVRNLFIKPFDGSYSGKGVGIYVHGQCYTTIDQVKVQELNYGIHLCNADAGSFTEFTTTYNTTLINCNQGIRIERLAGNDSFHGTRFHDVMINVQNGQYGIYIVGTSGQVFLYNSIFDVNLICENTGTPIGIYSNNCNTLNITGFIRSENPTYLQATSTGEFHMTGRFESLGGFSYVAGTPDGAFIFDNTRKGSNFTDSAISTLSPSPLPSSLVDRNTNGDYPFLFSLNGTNISSMGLATYSFSGNALYIGSVGFSGKVESFTPKFKVDSSAGQFIQSYNSNFYLTDNTATANQLQLSGGRVGGNIGRSLDYAISANAGVPQSITTIQNSNLDRNSIVYVRLAALNYEGRYLVTFNHEGYGGNGSVTTLATFFTVSSAGVSGFSFTVDSSGRLVVNITTDRAITVKCRELGLGTQLLS